LAVYKNHTKNSDKNNINTMVAKYTRSTKHSTRNSN